jgi:hypothetical protein
MKIAFGYNVQGNVKVKFFPKHATQAENRNSGIAILILNLSDRAGWVINAMPWLIHSLEAAPAPIVQKPGWAPGPVWMGAEKRKCLSLTGVQTLNHPAHSQSLQQQVKPQKIMIISSRWQD